MTPFYVCAFITAISALVSLGFSVASVLKSSGETRTSGLYTCARSFAFVVISIVPFVTGSRTWLSAVATGIILLQAADALVGITIRDTIKTFGPAGTAIANLAALVWLLNR